MQTLQIKAVASYKCSVSKFQFWYQSSLKYICKQEKTSHNRLRQSDTQYETALGLQIAQFSLLLFLAEHER